MAGFVVVAVIMRPVGGWLSDRFGPIPVLAAGYAVVVVGAAISAGTPPLDGVGHGRLPGHGRRARAAAAAPPSR